MVHYIIQTISFQLLCLLIYDLFLKKETFFNCNRVYILLTMVLSLIIPLIKINRFKNIISQDFIINLPEIIIGNTNKTEVNTMPLELSIVTVKSVLSLETMFYFGMCIVLLLFVFRITKLLRLIYKSPVVKNGNVFIVSLLDSKSTFSFFNCIFLGEYIKDDEKEAILKHEMAHVKGKHTLDLLFFEVLRILFWFNPLIYMYQNRMVMLHEFIADAQVVKDQNKRDYYQSLLSQVFDTKNISFINPFFKQSLIKKRIIMLSKSKSKQIKLFKYALLVPIVLGMLIYTSCENENEKAESQKIDLSQFSYQLNKDVEKNSEEQMLKKEKSLDFLKNNPDYVQWSINDHAKGEVSFSIHNKLEAIPNGYEQWETINLNGESAFSYKKNINISRDRSIKDGSIIDNKDYSNALEVPYRAIDQVPVFPECESLKTNEERKICTSRNISKHVNRNFNIKLASSLNLKGRQRINVIFKIDKEGNTSDVRSRAPHPDLEAEAIRVIKTLPKMMPGVHNGKKVIVPYSLPIIFQIQ